VFVLELEIKKKAVLGIVHNPIIKETYSAIAGKGAFLNNVQIHVSKTEEIKQSLLLTEFGYDRSKEGVSAMTERVHHLLLQNIQGVRCLGSCALNMCAIASGKAEIYYEGRNENYGPKPWDFTAPEVIVREAGGVIIDPNGSTFDCTKGRILCVNNQVLLEKILSLKLYSNQ